MRTVCTHSLFYVLLFSLLTFSPAVAQNIQTPDHEELDLGIQLFENGFFFEAQVKLQAFADSNPKHELNKLANFYIARSKAATDSARIEHYYKEFIFTYPGTEESVKLLKDLGHRFTQNREYDEAIDYYNKALNNWIEGYGNDEIQYWIAEAAAENEDYDASRNYFMKLADDFPDSDWAPKALYARGRLFLQEEKYNQASNAFEVLKERYPNKPITRRVGTALGESYYLQRKYTDAVEALEGALPYLDDESRIKAVFLIAESQNVLSNYDQASRYYLQYINLTKGTERERVAHYGLGWLYHKQEIYHWAAESFSKASLGDDEIARKALYYKAVNEKLGSQYAKSIETFREFGERYESGLWVEEAYYEWAVSAFQAGIYDESIEVLLSLIRNQETLKNPGQVYTLLGEAYFANAEYTRAIQAFEEAEKVTDLDPSVKRQARFQKAWILYRNQAYSQAQPIFEQVYAEAPTTDVGKEALFWSADSYYKLRSYGNAARRFNIFVENYPDHELHGAARYSLGWSYFQNGQYDRAIEPLRSFLNEYEPPPIALFPYDTDSKLRVGDAFYALGDYRQAISSYNQAIGAEPGGDYAMYQVANSYYRDGRTFEAVSNFRKMLRIYPFSRLREQAQYNVAYIYLNTNNYTQAVEEFQTVIEKYPGTEWAARSQYNIGDAFYNAGEYERAIEAYNKVLNEYPNSNYIIEAINGIQFAQLSLDGTDRSSEILEDFLGDNPSSSTADQLRFRQAETVFQSGDYENAIREFRQYLRVTNSDNLAPQAYANLAESYIQTNQPEEAVKALETVVNEYPDQDEAPSAMATLGFLYGQMGDYATAHEYYARLLEAAPRFRQDAYVGMGNASIALNMPDRAEDEFNAALEVNAGNEAAQIGLAKVKYSRENFDEAVQLLEPIAKENTTAIGAEAQYLLGELNQNREQFNEAIEAYSKVRVLFEPFEQWVAKSLLGTAECHIRLGNRGEAVNVLNTIIDEYPQSEEAERAQELLNRTR